MNQNVISSGAVSAPRRRAPDHILLILPGVAYLLILLVLPTLSIIGLSFQDLAGALSLESYERMFGARIYADVLINTLVISAQVTVACMLIGYPVAYWLSRLEGKQRNLFMWLVLLPFWASALIKNFAWLVLLARNGLVSTVLQSMGMDAPPELLFQRSTVIFAIAHTMMPLAIVVMLPTMIAIDRNLTLASRTLGAGPVQSFWRIFFPLSLPGAVAAGLLVFVGGIGFFITPQLVGGPRDAMISQLIITQVNQLLNWRMAGAITAMLLVVTIAVCLIYDRIFGISAVAGGVAVKISTGPKRKLANALIAAIASVTGGISELMARLLGGYRFGWLLPTFSIAVIVVLLVPVLSFLPMAFGESAFLEFPPRAFSFRWMETFLSSPIWTDATIRSFCIAAVTAVLATVIAGTAAFGVARSKSKLGGIAFLMFILPMIVPNIVIAVSLAYVFSGIGLLATDLGIVLGHTLTAIPVVFIITLTTFKAYDIRLDQAAATLGATPWTTLRRITLPICVNGLVAGSLFAFLHSFDELTIAMFVGAGLRQTLPKQMWDDVILSVSPTLAAASLVVLAVVTILFAVAERARPRA